MAAYVPIHMAITPAKYSEYHPLDFEEQEDSAIFKSRCNNSTELKHFLAWLLYKAEKYD